MRAKIHPILTYHDAKAAIAWLGEAFGFEPHAVYEGENSRIDHAELKLGDGIIMLSSKSDDIWSIASGPIAVSLPDGIDDHYERASAAGALIEREPFDTHYGSRDYAARDLEGNLWSFGTYMPE
jgi:uncharacterized glyoxalase superfamily protein PhnB